MSVPKRKRRTYLRADARRAQILDVAKQVFARSSYGAANIADICAAARIGRGTLYQYFPNKRAVLVAVMEGVAERVRRVIAGRPRVADVEGARGAPPAAIVAFTRRRLAEMLDAIFVDEATIRLVLRDARGRDGAVDQVIAMIDDLLLDAIEDDVRASQDHGLFRDGDPRLIAQFFLGGIEKMVLRALSGDAPVDRAALVRQAVDLELHGMLRDEVRAGKESGR